jgi:hypothetical protein
MKDGVLLLSKPITTEEQTENEGSTTRVVLLMCVQKMLVDRRVE